MSIYKMLIESVQDGNRFKIDLIKKNLWIGRKQIMKEGELLEYKDNLICPNDLEDFLEYAPVLNESCWNVADHLYEKYKHSSIKRVHLGSNPYFKANDVDELTDYDLAYGLNRNVAQAILEGYILLGGMIGWLELEDASHWFYQSKKQKDFVVLREWL